MIVRQSSLKCGLLNDRWRILLICGCQRSHNLTPGWLWSCSKQRWPVSFSMFGSIDYIGKLLTILLDNYSEFPGSPPLARCFAHNVGWPHDIGVSWPQEAFSIGAHHLGIRFSATDGDAGENARIRYALIGGNTQAHFTIDTETGHVSVVGQLDYETIRNYRLVIRAQGRLVTRPPWHRARALLRLGSSHSACCCSSSNVLAFVVR